MSKNIRIIFFVLLLVFIFFIVLLVRFNRIENSTSGSKTDNGLYEIRDSDGNIIVESQWKDAVGIDSERFIVTDPKSGKCGIVDKNENIVVPFVYSKFHDVKKIYLIGETEKNRNKYGYVLFDHSGNILIEEEWDSFIQKHSERKKDDPGFNYLELTKGSDICRIKNDKDNSPRMYYMELNRKILGENERIVVHPPQNILDLKNSYAVYRDIISRSTEFIEAVFSNDALVIKSLVSNDKYTEITQKSNAFRGCELRYLGNILPSFDKSEDPFGKTYYICRVSTLFTKPGEINADGTYSNTDKACEFTVKMETDSEGKLKITEFPEEKETDISKLKLPDSFFPEQTDVTSQAEQTTENTDKKNSIEKTTQIMFS